MANRVLEGSSRPTVVVSLMSVGKRRSMDTTATSSTACRQIGEIRALCPWWGASAHSVHTLPHTTVGNTDQTAQRWGYTAAMRNTRWAPTTLDCALPIISLRRLSRSPSYCQCPSVLGSHHHSHHRQHHHLQGSSNELVLMMALGLGWGGGEVRGSLARVTTAATCLLTDSPPPAPL